MDCYKEKFQRMQLSKQIYQNFHLQDCGTCISVGRKSEWELVAGKICQLFADSIQRQTYCSVQ